MQLRARRVATGAFRLQTKQSPAQRGDIADERAGGEPLAGGSVHLRLDVDLQARVVAPARRVTGGLRVLRVIEHAHQRLHVALGLHVEIGRAHV